jgi:hypothetical protein
VNDGRQGVVRAVDPIAKFAQRVDQGGLRTLTHARDAAHSMVAVAETQERREEARSCASVLDKELKRLLRACRRWESSRRNRGS